MKNMEKIKFAVFILTFGRPEKVLTYKTLRKQGYTGKIYLLCSDDDENLQKYKDKYKDEVIVFSKNDCKWDFDIADNFGEEKDNCVVFARNINFEIAKKMGLDYFLQLDDDYNMFHFKIPTYKNLIAKNVKDLDLLFCYFIEFLEKVDRVKSIAFSQSGDFIGGKDNKIFYSITNRRKIMNSFFNKVARPYKFYGRINEDVNCYIENGKRGDLFLTHPNICLYQLGTQSNSGGLTEIYLDVGTYIKSFYSVIFNPSAVKVKLMGAKHKRLHHNINWFNAVPMIIKEDIKKLDETIEIKRV
jgi:hypothetical protein